MFTAKSFWPFLWSHLSKIFQALRINSINLNTFIPFWWPCDLTSLVSLELYKWRWLIMYMCALLNVCIYDVLLYILCIFIIFYLSLAVSLSNNHVELLSIVFITLSYKILEFVIPPPPHPNLFLSAASAFSSYRDHGRNIWCRVMECWNGSQLVSCNARSQTSW